MKKVIKTVTEECLLCTKNKNSKVKYGKIKCGIANKHPMEFIAIDINGPLKTKHYNMKKENEYFNILT